MKNYDSENGIFYGKNGPLFGSRSSRSTYVAELSRLLLPHVNARFATREQLRLTSLQHLAVWCPHKSPPPPLVTIPGLGILPHKGRRSGGGALAAPDPAWPDPAEAKPAPASLTASPAGVRVLGRAPLRWCDRIRPGSLRPASVLAAALLARLPPGYSCPACPAPGESGDAVATLRGLLAPRRCGVYVWTPAPWPRYVFLALNAEVPQSPLADWLIVYRDRLAALAAPAAAYPPATF